MMMMNDELTDDANDTKTLRKYFEEMKWDAVQLTFYDLQSNLDKHCNFPDKVISILSLTLSLSLTFIFNYISHICSHLNANYHLYPSLQLTNVLLLLDSLVLVRLQDQSVHKRRDIGRDTHISIRHR